MIQLNLLSPKNFTPFFHGQTGRRMTIEISHPGVHISIEGRERFRNFYADRDCPLWVRLSGRGKRFRALNRRLSKIWAQCIVCGQLNQKSRMKQCASATALAMCCTYGDEWCCKWHRLRKWED